jgi:hypothetical protein
MIMYLMMYMFRRRELSLSTQRLIVLIATKGKAHVERKAEGRMLMIDFEDWNRQFKKPAKFRTDSVAINRKK